MSKRTFLLMPYCILACIIIVEGLVLSDAQAFLAWVLAYPVPSAIIGVVWAALMGAMLALSVSSHYFTNSGEQHPIAPLAFVVILLLSIPMLMLATSDHLIGMFGVCGLLALGFLPGALLTMKVIDNRFRAEYEARMRSRAYAALMEAMKPLSISPAKLARIYRQAQGLSTADIRKVAKAIALLDENTPAALSP